MRNWLAKRGSKVIILVAAAIVLTAVACAATDVLRIRFDNSLRSLDPAYTTHTRDYAVDASIYSTLVKYAPGSNKSEIVGDLAESWTISEDGLVYTFYLRQGVQWHKGYGELTSEDVKFSIERVMDPATASPSAWAYDAVAAVNAPDPYTVRIILGRPDPKLLHVLAPFRQGFIVCKTAVQEFGDEYGSVEAIGSGPFVFKEWIPNQKVVIESNADYYGVLPQLDRIEYVIIPDETTATLAMLNGEIDLMQFSTSEAAERLSQIALITIIQEPSMKTYAVAMNTRLAPLDDIRVRQAIALGIDQYQMVTALMTGVAVPSENFIAPGYAGHTQDVRKYPRDVEAARDLLAEAGYADGLNLNATITASFVDAYTVIQAQLEAIGIHLSIDIVDAGTWTERVMKKGEYQISVYSLGGHPVETSVFLKQVLHSSAFPPGLNYAWYSDVDGLIEQAETALDASERNALYEQIQLRVATDLPVYPLYYGIINVAHWDYVKGFELDIFHGEGDNLEYVYLDR